MFCVFETLGKAFSGFGHSISIVHHYKFFNFTKLFVINFALGGRFWDFTKAATGIAISLFWDRLEKNLGNIIWKGLSQGKKRAFILKKSIHRHAQTHTHTYRDRLLRMDTFVGFYSIFIFYFARIPIWIFNYFGGKYCLFKISFCYGDIIKEDTFLLPKHTFDLAPPCLTCLVACSFCDKWALVTVEGGEWGVIVIDWSSVTRDWISLSQH